MKVQNYFICDWWFNFDCATAEDLYSLNDDIAAEAEAASSQEVGVEYEGDSLVRSGANTGYNAPGNGGKSAGGSGRSGDKYTAPEEAASETIGNGYSRGRKKGNGRKRGNNKAKSSYAAPNKVQTQEGVLAVGRSGQSSYRGGQGGRRGGGSDGLSSYGGQEGRNGGLDGQSQYDQAGDGSGDYDSELEGYDGNQEQRTNAGVQPGYRNGK